MPKERKDPMPNFNNRLLAWVPVFSLLGIIYYFIFIGDRFTSALVQKSFIAQFPELLFLAIFVFIIGSLFLISISLEKRLFTSKIIIIGISAGIFLSYMYLFLFGKSDIEGSQIEQNMFLLFILLIGTISSVSLISAKYMRVTYRTTVTNAILFLIAFVLSVSIQTALLLNSIGLSLYVFLAHFVLSILLYTILLFRTKHPICDGRDVFKVTDLITGKQKGIDSKLTIEARDSKSRKITLYPKTGRASFEADRLEPGDSFECEYFKKEDDVYIVRELKKL